MVQLCELHDLDLNEEASRAAIERLLPHLSCRRITSLRITGCTYELAPEVPASLAHALYPELRRWVLTSCVLGGVPCTMQGNPYQIAPGSLQPMLPPAVRMSPKQPTCCPCPTRSLHLGGASLLHCSSFLPLCRRLEELTLCTSSMMHEARQLLRVHLR